MSDKLNCFIKYFFAKSLFKSNTDSSNSLGWEVSGLVGGDLLDLLDLLDALLFLHQSVAACFSWTSECASWTCDVYNYYSPNKNQHTRPEMKLFIKYLKVPALLLWLIFYCCMCIYLVNDFIYVVFYFLFLCFSKFKVIPIFNVYVSDLY